jgi:VWFA-related protein
MLELARGSNAVIYAVGFDTPTREEKEGFYTAMARESVWARRFSWTAKSDEPSRHQILKTLAESSGGRIWYADNESNLEQEFLKVLEEIQSRYLLTYYPDGVSDEGWHELKIRLKNRKGDVHARRGYLRPNTN